MCVQRRDHVRTQCEGGYLEAKERGIRRNRICQHLHLGFLAFRTEKINFCCLSHLVCGIYFVMVALANEYIGICTIVHFYSDFQFYFYSYVCVLGSVQFYHLCIYLFLPAPPFSHPATPSLTPGNHYEVFHFWNFVI